MDPTSPRDTKEEVCERRRLPRLGTAPTSLVQRFKHSGNGGGACRALPAGPQVDTTVLGPIFSNSPVSKRPIFRKPMCEAGETGLIDKTFIPIPSPVRMAAEPDHEERLHEHRDSGPHGGATLPRVAPAIETLGPRIAGLPPDVIGKWSGQRPRWFGAEADMEAHRPHLARSRRALSGID